MVAESVGLQNEHVRKLYHEAITQYGIPSQVDVSIEEMAELIKAIQKFRREDPCFDRPSVKTRLLADAICEEIADVQIMLDQLRLMFEDDNQVDNVMCQKQHRLAVNLGLVKEP